MSFVKSRFRKHRRSILFYAVLFYALYAIDYYLLSFSRVSHPTPPTEGLSLKLMEHVKTLAQEDWKGRKPKTEGNRQAATWIEEKFKSCGLQSLPSVEGYRQKLKFDLGDNIVGAKLSIKQSNRWMIVGAHFDHVGESGFLKRAHLGADDNASSVAILIELACNLMNLQNTNVLFVAYNTEEPPYFVSVDMGSQVFLDRMPAEVQTIVLTISMDLMGGAHWEPLLNSLFVVGAGTGDGLAELVRDTKLDGLTVSQLGYHAIERLPLGLRSPVSDYVPYIRQQIPSLLLTTGRTPRYHTTSDKFDTLDYRGMEKRLKWLGEFVARADRFDGTFTKPDAVDLDLEKRSLKEYAEKASHWATRVPGTSFISLYNFKRDIRRLEEATNDSDKRILIEKLVGRFQCTMMNLPICFLID